MASNKILSEAIRADYLSKIRESFEQLGDEVLVTGSNEVAIPVVDSEGNERWVQIVVKIPSGSRDGEPFDGYSLAEDYQMKCEEKRNQFIIEAVKVKTKLDEEIDVRK